MNTKAKPFCLVLMPFRPEFKEWYLNGIQPACGRAGAYSERIDEQHFEGFIIERIYNQIAKADIVIGELTGASVNVYYEVGYAHALGKRTILLV
jgi:nucleoside 2-deoxyribosyltransferase